MRKFILLSVLSFVSSLICAAQPLEQVVSSDNYHVLLSTSNIPDKAHVVVRCYLETEQHKLPEDGFIYVVPSVGDFGNIEARSSGYITNFQSVVLGSKIYLKDIDMKSGCGYRDLGEMGVWSVCQSRTIYIVNVTKGNEAIEFDLTNIQKKPMDVRCEF